MPLPQMGYDAELGRPIVGVAGGHRGSPLNTPFPTLITVQNLVVLSQTLWALLGFPENGSAGACPLGWGVWLIP